MGKKKLIDVPVALCPSIWLSHIKAMEFYDFLFLHMATNNKQANKQTSKRTIKNAIAPITMHCPFAINIEIRIEKPYARPFKLVRWSFGNS